MVGERVVRQDGDRPRRRTQHACCTGARSASVRTSPPESHEADALAALDRLPLFGRPGRARPAAGKSTPRSDPATGRDRIRWPHRDLVLPPDANGPPPDPVPFPMLTLGELGRLVDAAATPVRRATGARRRRLRRDRRHPQVRQDVRRRRPRRQRRRRRQRARRLDRRPRRHRAAVRRGRWPPQAGAPLPARSPPSTGSTSPACPCTCTNAAPKLGELAQVERLRVTVELHQPRLVILDPAYLALAGADTRNLAVDGRAARAAPDDLPGPRRRAAPHPPLEQDRHRRQRRPFHRRRVRRMGTGAHLRRGPLVAVDPSTKRSSVLCKLEIVGDELADTGLAVPPRRVGRRPRRPVVGDALPSRDRRRRADCPTTTTRPAGRRQAQAGRQAGARSCCARPAAVAGRPRDRRHARRHRPSVEGEHDLRGVQGARRARPRRVSAPAAGNTPQTWTAAT